MLHFPTNKTKTLRNHQSFHGVAPWKIYQYMLENISSDVKCGCKDWGQGRGNMKKSSFAFKRNAMKRSKLYVYFLLLDLFKVWFDSQLWMRIVSQIHFYKTANVIAMQQVHSWLQRGSYRCNNFIEFTNINCFVLCIEIAFYNLQTLTYLKLPSRPY